jgi:outer membrane receptor protein involved in Fe transport
MKNVPSVSVDIDGNVTLRNSPPQIYVDGRPTTLTLDQIPADQIASIEVITNPSAKFDASGGTSGILNIVLKKNRKAGYNGNLRAGIDMRGKFNAGGDINIRQGNSTFLQMLIIIKEDLFLMARLTGQLFCKLPIQIFTRKTKP